MVIQGRELGQFVTDFIWYLRNLLVTKSVDDAEVMLDMSTENMNLLKEQAKLVEDETLLRYIRVFSDLSNQLRYASQKRVLIEVALIRLTRPQMEENLDSVLERVRKIEQQLEEGVFTVAAPGTTIPEDTGGTAGGGLSGGSLSAEPSVPAERVALPPGQLEDLNLIRNEWGKIVRELGGPIRASFRDTVVEPAGDSSLCVVFTDQSNFIIGSRPTTLGEIERYVEEHYQKAIYFRARLKGGGERLDTIYVSDDELKASINMDITIED